MLKRFNNLVQRDKFQDSVARAVLMHTFHIHSWIHFVFYVSDVHILQPRGGFSFPGAGAVCRQLPRPMNL